MGRAGKHATLQQEKGLICVGDIIHLERHWLEAIGEVGHLLRVAPLQ
jgi:hypothetical protein